MIHGGRLLRIELTSCVDCPYMYMDDEGLERCGHAGWDRSIYQNVTSLEEIPYPCPLPKIPVYVPLDERPVIP